MSRVSAIEGRATEACVVVGCDGSDCARRAVAQSVRAAGPGGQVILVAVEPKMPADGIVAEPFIEPGEHPSQLLADAHAVAARTCATGAADVRMVAREGNPADEILAAARAADADLVVVGRTGKNFLARAILGSVAVRVVKLAHCDVLVVA
jgi:nucleotide-binding universal stress UspA family protein